MKRSNYFFRLLKARKTTYEFSDKKVKDSEFRKILEAGRWAPSCTNTQPWHFILIKNKARIGELMKTANYGDFHDNPSAIIALVLKDDLCLGPDKICFRNVTEDIQDSYMSIAMTALQMLLEATELGISSCILTPKQSEAKKILRVSKKDDVPLFIGFGYEKNGAYRKKRERRAFKEMVSYEYIGGKG